MEVNLFGAVHCTQACVDDLIAQRGLIITVSSIAGVAPLYGRTGYSASKHALHGLFESIGAELADDGVHVLMVCPSFVESGLEASTMGADGERIDRPRSKVGQLRQPDQVAAAVVKAARSRTPTPGAHPRGQDQRPPEFRGAGPLRATDDPQPAIRAGVTSTRGA